VLAHDVPEGVALLEARSEQGRLGEEAPLLHGAGHDGDEGVGLKGLGEVVFGAEFDGLDGAVDGAKRRHHHHHGARRSGAHLAQQPDAVEAGHLQVGEHQVGREAPQLPQRLEPIPRRLRLVSLLAENFRQGRPRVGLVIDDQDSTLGLGHGSAAL
jgi:hypothetical protein